MGQKKIRPRKPGNERDFPPPFAYKFRAGPYIPPKVSTGTKIKDVYAGDVTVVGTSKAPIPWPAYQCTAGRREGPMPVFTGDLVRAVCEEEEIIVAHYWGVTRHMVNRWKCAIAEATDSNEVAVNIALLRATPEFRKKYGYRI